MNSIKKKVHLEKGEVTSAEKNEEYKEEQRVLLATQQLLTISDSPYPIQEL